MALKKDYHDQSIIFSNKYKKKSIAKFLIWKVFLWCTQKKFWYICVVFYLNIIFKNAISCSESIDKMKSNDAESFEALKQSFQSTCKEKAQLIENRIHFL